MELNREQIIKAFECCTLNACNCTGGCPYRGTSGERIGEECWRKARNDVYSLLNELTEENERLRVVADMSDATLTYALRVVNEFCDKRVKRATADTVRKMQTEIEARCIKGGIYPAFVKRTIDNVAEEMIGG